MAAEDEQRLRSWVIAAGFEARRLERLGGDVSPRVYYRAHAGPGRTAILAVYPSEINAIGDRFARTTSILAAAAVPVPRILAHDREAGLMLLEDAGAATLYELRDLGWARLMPYLERAVDLAGRIAALDPEPIAALNPPLDAGALRAELDKTSRELLEPRGLAGEGRFRHRFAAALDRLCEGLAAEPVVPCHRDFMARNLLPASPPPSLRLIDHQDLRLGPRHYDLASLLNDSLYPPPEHERALLERGGVRDEELIGYRRAAAQRTLKAAGTFAAFSRRGFDTHLRLIPKTLGRALDHLERLPETRELAPRLAELWRDAAARGRGPAIC